jgi:TPP-dependent 2-oxoacid decarboxylase
MKTSDLIVQCLENRGVRYVFGLPGDYRENAKLTARPGQLVCPI